MLDPRTNETLYERGAASPASQDVGLRELFDFIRKSAPTIAATTLLAAIGGFTYVLTTTPNYVAAAQIILEPQKSQQLIWQDPGVVDLTVGSAQVESQVEVLRSDPIALSVIKTLGLADDPEFSPDADRANAAVSSSWLGGLVGPSTVTPLSPEERLYIALAAFKSRIDVRRVGQSYIVQIWFRSQSPDKAATIANAVAEAFIQDQLDAKTQAARQGREWLEERIKQLRVQLHAAVHAVQDFRNRSVSDASGRAVIEAEVTLSELESAASTYRKMYESFLQKLAETAQKESFPGTDARVIGTATRPLSRVYPKPNLVMALAVLAGIIGGILIAAVRHATDRRLRSAQQLTQLGLASLGLIPHARRRWQAHSSAREVVRFPFSPFAEALRRVKTAIDIARIGRPLRTIGIVSNSPSRTRTTIASNMAALFAIGGRRVLLIDGDLRSASLTKALNMRTDVGLLDTLSEGSDAIRKDDIADFFVLPASQTKPFADSNSMLISDAMGSLLERASSTFEVVLIDLPPLSAVADALAVGPYLDAYILVAEYGRTPIDQIESASRSILPTNAQLLGVIIADVPETLAGFEPILGALKTVGKVVTSR